MAWVDTRVAQDILGEKERKAMKKRFLTAPPPAATAAALLVLLLLGTGTAPAFIDRGGVVARSLPGGLTVLVREEPAQKVVELQAWVGVGSKHEPAGKEGIAHLFEHMLFKGTDARGTGEIASAVESAGGEINAFTSPDETVYHVTISAAYFTTALVMMISSITWKIAITKATSPPYSGYGSVDNPVGPTTR